MGWFWCAMFANWNRYHIENANSVSCQSISSREWVREILVDWIKGRMCGFVYIWSWNAHTLRSYWMSHPFCSISFKWDFLFSSASISTSIAVTLYSLSLDIYIYTYYYSHFKQKRHVCYVSDTELGFFHNHISRLLFALPFIVFKISGFVLRTS